MQDVLVPSPTSDLVYGTSQPIRRILVLLDGVRNEDDLLAAVSHLARGGRAEVILACSCGLPVMRGANHHPRLRRQSHQLVHSASLLLARREHALRMLGCRVSGHLLRGSDVGELLSAAVDCHADLLVAATTTDTSAALLRSDATGVPVASRARLPVLLTPPVDHVFSTPSPKQPPTIFIPLSESTSGDSELAEAVRLARILAATIVLVGTDTTHLHVAEANHGTDDDPAHVATMQLSRRLERMCVALGDAGVSARASLSTGELIASILQQIHRDHDLVVLGVPGAHDAGGARLEYIVRLFSRAGAPVLLVPASSAVNVRPLAPSVPPPSTLPRP